MYIYSANIVKNIDLCKRLKLDTGTVTPMLKNTEKQFNEAKQNLENEKSSLSQQGAFW